MSLERVSMQEERSELFEDKWRTKICDVVPLDLCRQGSPVVFNCASGVILVSSKILYFWSMVVPFCSTDFSLNVCVFVERLCCGNSSCGQNVMICNIELAGY